MFITNIQKYGCFYINLVSYSLSKFACYTNFYCTPGECFTCKIVLSIYIDELALLPFQCGYFLFFCPIALDRTYVTKLKMSGEIRHSDFVLILNKIHSVSCHYVTFGFFRGGAISCHF